jgi:F0F1-type ATP synthase assembly protein I
MPTEDDVSNQQVKDVQASFQLAFTVLAQVGLLSLVIVIGALVAGIVLDRVLETRPLFTVLLMLASFPALMYSIYRVAMRAVARIKPTRRASPAVKED